MSKSNKSITTEAPVKADAAVAPRAEPKLTPYAAMLAALTQATLAPKVRFDGAVAFARSIGAPDRFSTYRDEVLSAVGRLVGEAKRTTNGSKGTVALNLKAAMASVAKHEATKSKESGEAAKVALADLVRVLAIENAIDAGRGAEFAIAGE